MASTSHILYIEDNEFNQRLIKKILEPAGFMLSEALDGIKGIKKAIDLRPDLILMDLELPYLDGLGAATKIKSVPGMEQVPIIALTSKTCERDRQRALVAGCDGYIEKPINALTFADQIRTYLEGKRETSAVSEDEHKILKNMNVDLVDQLRDKVEELELANQELMENKEALQNAYQQSQDWNLELQRLTKLKENIVAITSHELRTPLSIAQGYMEVLLEGMVGELNEDQYRLLQISGQSLKRMNDLVDKITDLTRLSLKKSPMNLEELDLNEVFSLVQSDLSYFMRIRGIELKQELSETKPLVLADQSLLNQVFSNLLKNAICFTPDDGKITARSYTDGEKVYFQLEDTGVGLKEEDVLLIFDEFYQVHDVQHHKSGSFEFMTRGIGVGLALCQGILNELGGKIWAESPGLNKGSTFTFYLPMVN